MWKLDEAGLRSRLELMGVRATLKTKEAEARVNVEVICRLEERLSEANSGVEELRTV